MTLEEARADLHRLDARRTMLRLRIRRGEFVAAFAARSAAVTFGHSKRDQLLNLPYRHSAILAAEHGVPAGVLMVALSKMLHEECHGIATGRHLPPDAA